MALLYDRVVHTVTKSPENRTDAEIEQILPWFRKKSELFKSQKAEIVKDILKNCEFMTCRRDYVIIKQGDKGDCFFIILNGAVAIHIHTTLGEDGILYDQTPETPPDKDKKHASKPKKELDRSIFGNFVGKIPAGRSFGELALINADCVRNASIIADETTDLIVVNRDLYNRSLKAFQEKEFNEKKRFVEEYPLFRGWQLRYKKQMAMSLRKEKVNFDGILLKQGSPLDGVCFLLGGQAKMLVDPGQHEVQYADRFPLPDIAELEKTEARESIRREMNMAVPREERKNIYQRSKSPNPSDRKRSHKVVEVCVIGAIETIGDLEMVFGLNSYAQTTQCTEAAEMFVLDQKNYERLIEKRNPQSLDMMRESLHEKLQLRLSWAGEADLPLFRYFLYKLEERKRQEENKIRDYNRRRDIRTEVDFWKTGKLFNGPLIDQYGPGSVFYTIRMRSKTRKDQMKAKLGSTGFGITRSLALMSRNSSGAYLSRKNGYPGSSPNLVTSHNGVHANGFGKHGGHKSSGSDSEDDEGKVFTNDQDNENDSNDSDGPPRSKTSKVLCDNASMGKNTNSCKGSPDFTDSNRNSRIPKNSRSSCSVDDFMRHDLNELSLTRLETRIEEWHTKLNKLEVPKETYSRHDKKQHLVKLHRYNAEVGKESKKPFPGKKIVLKPKARPKPTLLTLQLDAIDTHNRPATPPVVADEQSQTASRDHFEESRGPIEDETDGPYRRSIRRRPLSSKPVGTNSPIEMRRRSLSDTSLHSSQPKSARNYTAEDYSVLKDELRRKEIAYKSLLIRCGTVL